MIMVRCLRFQTATHVFLLQDHKLTEQTVKTFDDYNMFLPPKGAKAGRIFDKMRSNTDIKGSLDKIKGHLVWMPMDFLKDAQMAETGLQVNSWTESIYT